MEAGRTALQDVNGIGWDHSYAHSPSNRSAYYYAHLLYFQGAPIAPICSTQSTKFDKY